MEVKETLTKIFSKKDLPQSFLFAGPKGSGKTSAARIVAKLINCENAENGEPCGKCDVCKTIDKGRSTDIVEIDAASNRGIDDVRVLRDQAYLMPTSLKKKVFIIDEVHMLTKEAFNALLKLLEEPPKHTTFILCTTDPAKIPDTVLSRLVRVNFKKGKKNEILKSLKRSLEGEGIKASDEVLELVFKKSEGSFRNAQRMMTEIVLELGGDKISDITSLKESQILGLGEYGVEELEQDLVDRKAKLILEKLEIMADKGVDFGDYRNKLIEYFQQKILSAYGVGDEDKSKMSLVGLTKWVNLLIAAGKFEKDVEIDQLPLELAVVEFLGDTGEGEIVKKVEEKRVEEKIKDLEKPVNEAMHVVDFPVVTVEEIEKEWGRLLGEIKPFNHSVEAFLRSARPKSVEKNTIVIEVYYPFHKDKLSEDKNRRVLEDGFRKIFGAGFLVECVVAKDKREPLVIGNETDINQMMEAKKDGKVGEEEIYDIAKEIFG